MALQPRVLYNNVLRGITPTWSGTTVAEKPPAAATDWKDYTLFQANSGNLAYTMATDTTIDSWAVYTKEASGNNQLILEYETASTVWSTLDTIFVASEKLDLRSFSSVTVSAGLRIRIRVIAATNIDIRQLCVGQYLEMERGQWATAMPPTFVQGIKVTNTISENGSILGRSIKRTERTGKIQLDHLTASWVRSSWEPFAKHAARYPFFYQWDPVTYDDEVGMAVAQTINPPKNAGNGYLSVEMPLRVLVSDSEAV